MATQVCRAMPSCFEPYRAMLSGLGEEVSLPLCHTCCGSPQGQLPAWPQLASRILPPETSTCSAHKLLIMDLQDQTRLQAGQRVSLSPPSLGHSHLVPGRALLQLPDPLAATAGPGRRDHPKARRALEG